MFIDKVIVHVKAGTGGSGATSFRREKFVPMGGPDGGEGGRGGDVIVRGDRNLATLLDFTYRDRWEAERGDHGEGSNKTGRSGGDVVLPVPPGTVIRDHETSDFICEILADGEEFIVAKGGRGGKGNAWFVSSTHQSPREWEPGREGEERGLRREIPGRPACTQLLVPVAKLAFCRFWLAREQLDEPRDLGQPDERHAKPEVEVDLPASCGEPACLLEVVLHRLESGERGRDVGFQLDVLARVLEQTSATA